MINAFVIVSKLLNFNLTFYEGRIDFNNKGFVEKGAQP